MHQYQPGTAPITPLRVAIVGNAGGAMANFRAPLIADILARGHDVFALAPDFDDGMKSKLRGLGAKCMDYPLSRTGLDPFRDLADMLALRGRLKEIEPDLVLSFGIKPVIYGSIASRWAGIPRRFALITGLGYAFTQDGKARLKRRFVGALARLFYRFSLAFAERVFVQNPDDFKDLVDIRIAPASKITIVNGTGVELDKWLPAPPVLSPVTFTLAARLLKDKGVVEFVEAARMVKSCHPSARFVLIGAMDSNPQAIDSGTLSSWVDEGVVEWPGHVNMKEWLAQTSVFVLPSYREGVPRSTQEAMAMARPVITTDVPGCRETVVDGQNGFLVPPRNSAAIATAMKRFIAELELIASMGAESRKLAEARFDVHKVNAIMIEAMNL